jgi:cytochrome P450
LPDEFHQDPLLFLDRGFAAAGETLRLPGGQLCVADPAASRAVLANDQGLYQDHSDFFHSKRGLFGPRSAQEEMGRASRTLLRAHVAARADRLADSVARALVPSSEWPDAGNWLVYRHFQDAVIAPDSPPRLRRILDQVVERAVLAGARERRSRLTRAIFRFQVMRELSRAIRERRALPAREPVDLLDVAACLGEGAREADRAEVFLSFLFAAAGSVGFVLGWSVYLLGTHPGTATEPAWVVREALRLWPVAWMLERYPVQPHEVAGTPVAPGDRVVVCPYAVHRNPRHWEEPEAFRPERWATVTDHHAFLPFGWGPHRCVAAALSLQLAEDILGILIRNYRLDVTLHEKRPFIAAALAPPRFTLGLEPAARR